MIFDCQLSRGRARAPGCQRCFEAVLIRTAIRFSSTAAALLSYASSMHYDTPSDEVAARAKLWRRRDVAARGVFARGASRRPLLGCACLRRPLSMWPTAASSCRRARTTTSLPGRGAGRLLAHRRDDWYLSRSCPATGPCRSPPLTCPCAQLASRAAHRCSPGSLCARATQGSETLLCAAGLTRLFGSCAYWYMRGIHRWCGWPQAGISAGR